MTPKKREKKSSGDKKTAKSADVVELVPTEASAKVEKETEPAPLAPPPVAPVAGDKKLRDLCKELGISDIVLAGMISVSPDVVAMWKNETKAPQPVIDMLQRKADFKNKK